MGDAGGPWGDAAGVVVLGGGPRLRAETRGSGRRAGERPDETPYQGDERPGVTNCPRGCSGKPPTTQGHGPLETQNDFRELAFEVWRKGRPLGVSGQTAATTSAACSAGPRAAAGGRGKYRATPVTRGGKAPRQCRGTTPARTPARAVMDVAKRSGRPGPAAQGGTGGRPRRRRPG